MVDTRLPDFRLSMAVCFVSTPESLVVIDNFSI
jgi:hypothetical protein